MVVNEIGKKYLFFDGAMGTVLQKSGLKLGEVPEFLNFTHADLIRRIHEGYLEVGADFITTNTFGANRYKVEGTDYTVETVVGQAVKLAKEAVEAYGKGAVVLDIGPTGKIGRAHV